MKKNYEQAELEIISLEAMDIICESNPEEKTDDNTPEMKI